MKYLNKISVLLMVLAAGLFTACNTDQEGPIYTETGEGVTFSSASLTSQVVTVGVPTFSVDLFRATANDALSGNIGMFVYVEGKDEAGNTIAIPVEGYANQVPFSFEAGKYQTTISVDATPLAVGDEVLIDLSLPEGSSVAVSGSNVTTVAVTKDYTWQSIGKGVWTDGLVSSLFNVPAGTNVWEVEVEQAVENQGMYRMVNPYGFEICPWVAENEVTVDPCYVKIDASDPENVVVPQQSMGINWGYGEFVVGSMAALVPGSPYGVKTGNVIDLGTTVFVAMGADAYLTNVGSKLELPE